MLPEVNQVISDFKLIKKEFVAEIGSDVLHFEHQKTKATLVAVKNDDTNKNFCITFKTTPQNSTGVAHILEHAVLSGSVKYPLKDVFSELVKGSLTTFLNAMTGSDKTYYPFSTRNLKEYYNIMDVYLDTTLNPLLKEETFLQEGWHHELLSADEKVSYKGIVFNEMKGAMSDPMSQLIKHLYATMYPGTTYEYNSGGDPEVIPELSYEQFKQFHADYYHPSNSIIFIYGDAPLAEELSLINDKFLNKFSYNKVNSEIKPGRNITEFTYNAMSYGVAPDEDLANKAYLALGVDITTADDQETVLAMNIVTDLLFNSESSPLKQAIMAAGITHDVSGYYNNHMYFTNVDVLLMGTDENQKDKFLEIYYSALKQIVADGIDKEHIISEINNLEFKIRESGVDVRRGFNYMMSVANAASYGIDIFESLKIDDLFAVVREKAMTSRYMEDLIEKYLINNPRTALVALVPDPAKAEKDQEKELQKLADFQKSLNPAEISELIVKSNNLIELQKQEDTLENIQKLPKLSLSDIERKVNLKEPDVKRLGDITVLSNDLYTNDILYLSIGLRMEKIPVELLPYMELFSELITELGTKNRNYMQLDCELKASLGGFTTNLQIHSRLDDATTFQPIMWIETKAFAKNIDKMIELIADMVANLDLDNKERIEEVIMRNFTHKERQVQSEGFIYPITRIKSYLSAQGQYADHQRGMRAYQTFKTIARNYKQEEESFIAKLHRIKEILFNRENLIFNITADHKITEQFLAKSDKLIEAFGTRHFDHAVISFPDAVKNEAFQTQAQIVFAAQGANIYHCGLSYSGRLEVLKNYLSGDYLFNKIRIQGGAYGCMIRFNECEGELIFISYRDPNVKETYEAFAGIPAVVAELEMSDEQFNNLKLGAYSDFDPLQNVFTRGIVARNNYLAGISPSHFNKIIEEILDTTVEDLRQMAPALQKFIDASSKCIIGNSAKIEENKDLFNELIQV